MFWPQTRWAKDAAAVEGVGRASAAVSSVVLAVRRIGVVLSAIVLSTVLAGTQDAWGQTVSKDSAENKAAAEALFDEALALLRKEQLAEACKKFEQSQRIDPAVGTLLYLAECYERTGKVASAWATFREASSVAAAEGQAERASIGAQRAQRLEARLSRVTFDPGDNAKVDGFTLTREGLSIAPAVYGVAVPVDPGVHSLVASAPGYESWQLQLSVPEQPSNQTVTIPPLKALPQEPETAVAPPVAVDEPPASPPLQDSAPAVEPSADYTWAWVSAGVGVVGIGAGIALGVRAKNLDEDAKQYCTGNACFDRRGETASKDAQSAALLANVGYAVGAAGLITSAVLVVLAVQPDESPTGNPSLNVGDSTWLTPEVSAHGGGFTLQGAF